MWGNHEKRSLRIKNKRSPCVSLLVPKKVKLQNGQQKNPTRLNSQLNLFVRNQKHDEHKTIIKINHNKG